MSVRHSLLHKPVLLSTVPLVLRVVMIMLPMLVALSVVMIMPSVLLAFKEVMTIPPVLLEPREVIIALLVHLGFGPLVLVVLTLLPQLTATNRDSRFPGQTLLSPVFVFFICFSFLLGLRTFVFYLQHTIERGFLDDVPFESLEHELEQASDKLICITLIFRNLSVFESNHNALADPM